MEEWVARRINSAHVLKPCLQSRKRNYLYVVMEFIDGQTLTQWMIDNPKPRSRDRARHRRADRQGPAGLPPHGDAASGPAARQHHDRQDRHGEDHRFRFDQGEGVVEAAPSTDRDDILGTVQYTAPEYFLGESGSSRSDIFSLGVITYQMLTGRLPYGAEVAKTQNEIAAAQVALRIRARRQPRDSGVDRRGAQEGGASGSVQALRGAVRIRL